MDVKGSPEITPTFLLSISPVTPGACCHLFDPSNYFGLPQSGLRNQPDPDFFIGKMVDQAHEIDTVIKQINLDLKLNDAESVDVSKQPGYVK